MEGSYRISLAHVGPCPGAIEQSFCATMSSTHRALRQRGTEYRARRRRGNLDMSLTKRIQASPSFGRILEAAPPRLIQFGLKFLFSRLKRARLAVLLDTLKHR